MGEEISSKSFSRQQRTRYRERLQHNLDDFAKFLTTESFVDEGTIGLEMEINLVDEGFQPSLRNAQVLDNIADESFQTELGAFNIELNYPVLSINGDGLAQLEQGLKDRLDAAAAKAADAESALLLVGTLPTLTRELLQSEDWMSPGKRYEALNESVLQARGEDVELDIHGDEDLSVFMGSVAPEAACTSVQFHLQVSPRRFPGAWNASQIIAGPQLALAANSPLFLGKRLWHETRVELIKQAIDTRAPEMQNQGVRPRVWFGERWITSIFDLLEENVRYFPALLPELREDQDTPEFTESGAPVAHELRLHNGTVYRWNRPIYDPGTDKPHLRVENRVLPAGPTLIDTVANAAFYFGLVESLQREDRPLWSRMSFSSAEENFIACARDGLGAQVYWPGVGNVPVDELIVKLLLPMAAKGLRALNVDEDLVTKYLGILHDRATSNQNGAQWQLDCLERLEANGMDRKDALTELTRLYAGHSRSNQPVHTWPLPG
ncbi:glutamate--cysteine ligase [Saxibacter everestensis]|uniref:Glutamate--cysteine ligase n=1 Tax=Saxibacter everestensis TaxID=2909229 RepID=A0ABY8QSY5_9MICO|nr:glutamate--cysteine ligase [Brevibacteriaceae bacterium ZFBP1038]